MAKKPVGRVAQEEKEALPIQETMVPGNRFQQKQQVQDADEALDTKAPSSSFNKKKVESKGSVLKQEVASNVVTQGVGGVTPEAASGTYSLKYSGNEGTILGSAAYTPSVGQSRSDSRIGKKLDSVTKKINFVASEQVIQEFDESKALAQNPEAVQGYNGSYRNENARSQKIVGGVPGSLLFQRSVDELKRNQVYFSLGQHVDTQNVSAGYTPSYLPTKSVAGVWSYPSAPNYELRRGNYLPRNFRFKFNENGKLEKFYFDVDDVSTSVEQSIGNKAATNAIIDANNAEMDRQIMDAKAGDEKAELWTPLARAVKEPTQTVALLRDMEAITGSEVFAAYKKTAACHSYQLNRAAKDGMKVHTPMTEALLGLMYPEVSSADLSNVDPFDVSKYTEGDTVAGTSAIMISAFDSTTKYRTKADILTMPRSFKMHLQTADNNMNPLRVKREFAAAMNNREVFSTIDRDYDPLMPVCISDRAAIIHPYSYNDLFAWNSLNASGGREYMKTPFRYMYSDLRNHYVVEASIPLLSGLASYLEANSQAFMSKVGTKEVVVPCVHSTCFFSMWSLLVLAATPFILNERVNSLRDVLYYEKNVEYPFHQLTDIGHCNPMNAVNYDNSDYQQPLVTRQMIPSVRATWVMPELFWPFDEQSLDDTYKYVLPWYFNQEEFDFTSTSAYYNGDKCAMTMPSVRSGARLGYLDDIYSMSERDLRLCLDRLVGVPSHETGAGSCGVYKYDQNSDGIPFLTMSKSDFNIGSFCSLPREQGFFFVAPAGLLDANISGMATMNDFSTGAPADHGHFGQSSYILKFWHGTGARPLNGLGEEQNILDPVTINVNRATAYKQDWDSYRATIDDSSSVIKDFGWIPAINQLFNSATGDDIFGRSSFIPFTTGVISNGSEEAYSDRDEFAVRSMQKAIWTRIQMLPMALSPFDFTAAVRKIGEDSIKIDPYDFLFYFGLAGFRASDYREDVYNRSNESTNLGFQYLKDLFITDSPVFKESMGMTQIVDTNSMVI